MRGLFDLGMVAVRRHTVVWLAFLLPFVPVALRHPPNSRIEIVKELKPCSLKPEQTEQTQIDHTAAVATSGCKMKLSISMKIQNVGKVLICHHHIQISPSSSIQQPCDPNMNNNKIILLYYLFNSWQILNTSFFLEKQNGCMQTFYFELPHCLCDAFEYVYWKGKNT